MIKKKKLILIIISLVMVLMAGTLIFLYYYERPSSNVFVRDSYIPATVISKYNKWGTKNMEVYQISFFGAVESKGNYPTNDDVAVNLTAEQIASIRNILEDRHFEPYLKLWYRYDAMLGDGNKVTYKLDFKNQLVFADEMCMTMQKAQKVVRGCIRLTDEENQILQDMLKGTEK